MVSETGRGKAEGKAQGKPLTETETYAEGKRKVGEEPKDRGVSPQRALSSPHLGLSQEN